MKRGVSQVPTGGPGSEEGWVACLSLDTVQTTTSCDAVTTHRCKEKEMLYYSI